MTDARSPDDVLSVARLLLHVVPRLNRWVEARASEGDQPATLSLRQLSALSLIRDQPTTLGQVARELLVTPAVVTGLIDRLERRGYVRRESGADDRRRVLLTLTEEGRQAYAAMEDRLAEEIGDRLATLEPDELRTLGRALIALSDLRAPAGDNQAEHSA